MSETPKADEKLSLEQLVRLKHNVDKSIPYGEAGLNAKQIAELHRMSAEDWAAVRQEYGAWIKRMYSFRKLTLFIIAAAGVGFWFYLKAWPRMVALAFAILSAIEICKREGHREGYMDGYSAGFERGVNKAIGLNNEEAVEAAQMATEIQIDEHMVKAFDERADPSNKTEDVDA